MIRFKRMYEKPERADGFRILVDRLWPRGVRKQSAKVDVWMAAVAPSHALRKWFAHDPRKWSEFQRRYRAELRKNTTIKELRALLKQHRMVTLLFSAKDEFRNNAVVLKKYLAS